ncbi:hypothetical protein CGSMWGv00703Bmash_01199 [Gardnerella pickettii 00703Bmash]|uniref:Uncharacterized protein n=1 Tax=Gardnerella pickettii JCP8017A TaxID=1261062 RepID=T2PMR6_9BIFI|nr:hypothetical protein CGSMWGv00703Bmash_01199 [Gardnerella pickettii 00703Bmash]EPI53640.1 hypothetical protein HMPREF1577_00030 [Gardnerella pickettii JCP8017A]EPI62233.1 hypothetical protein HMPREF1578_00170 [Gardnerella pickettii JCP8017B]
MGGGLITSPTFVKSQVKSQEKLQVKSQVKSQIKVANNKITNHYKTKELVC